MRRLVLSARIGGCIGYLIAAVVLWPHYAAAQVPNGSLPGVKFEILPGDGMGNISNNCRDFVVTNQTSSFVDVYVRYDYRFEATSATTKWIGMRWIADDGPFGRVAPDFANMYPGEKRTRAQFEMENNHSEDGTKSFGSLWAAKMLESRANWNEERKCASWDYDIRTSADSVRSEVNDTQRLLERKIAERDARLREVAEDTAKWLRIATKPPTGSEPHSKTPGPGALLAQADKLAEDGDKTGSQRLLRQLISEFPDHTFAGYAADRLSAVATGALGSSVISAQNGGARTGGGDNASPCDLTDDMRRRVRAMCPAELEAFAAGEARRLGNKTVEQVRQDAVMAVTQFCPASNLQKREVDFREWVEQTAQIQAPRWRDYFSCVYIARGFETAQIPQRGGSGRSASAGATASAGDCKQRLDSLDQQVRTAGRRALPNEASAAMRRVMWATAELIKVIDQYCPASEYRTLRQETKAQYDQAERACESTSSGGRCPGPNAF